MRAAEATEILTALRHFATSLADAEAELNAINVFPIADGDTGTNMRRTIEAMIDELEAADAGGDLGAAVAIAALNAARGNSGLICAQYLAGLLTLEPDRLFADGEVMASSFARAASSARAAVAEPVEGTMVSVADCAARAAAGWLAQAGAPDDADPTPATDAGSGGAPRSPAPLLSAVYEVVQQAVADTRYQLPVLTEAGVVDAGAAGLLLLFEALADGAGAGDALSGRPLELGLGVEPGVEPGLGVEPGVEPDSRAGPGPATLVGFELQFTADGDAEQADALRTMLGNRGQSVVVSQAEGLIRAHVHLTDIGPAVEAVLDLVRPRNIEIEPLTEETRP